jgi:GNAT superfamily N-acetyltransferase
MTVTASTLDAVSRVLPRGYRAREFAEPDRDPLTAERNADLPEVEQESASDWREWERLMPDPTKVRIVVESDSGEIAAFVQVSNGGPFKAPDGSTRGSVDVARAHRHRGLGSALLPILEDEARRMNAPKMYGGVSARDEDALPWAARRGYHEIGRRIQAAIDLPAFEPERWQDRVRKAAAQGITFVTLADRRRKLDDDAFERLLRQVYDVEDQTWGDVPIAGPFPHWSYETFRRLTVESPGSALDLDVLAYDGDSLVGFTSSYREGNGKKGGTGYTCVVRTHRGRGIAFALKVDVLGRAKASRLRWMLTTNDEPNKAMKGINYSLGYTPLPAHIQLEKTL